MVTLYFGNRETLYSDSDESLADVLEKAVARKLAGFGIAAHKPAEWETLFDRKAPSIKHGPKP